jgi:uncharacterized protein (DUF433 family)
MGSEVPRSGGNVVSPNMHQHGIIKQGAELEGNMELKSYFEFLSPDDIRIKGTRVGIETVLDDYLNGSSPEEIAVRYRTLTLEQVYATITYYLHNQEEVDAYLARWRAYGEAAWQEQQRNPPEFVRELRERIQHKREVLLAEKGPAYLTANQK